MKNFIYFLIFFFLYNVSAFTQELRILVVENTEHGIPLSNVTLLCDGLNPVSSKSSGMVIWANVNKQAGQKVKITLIKPNYEIVNYYEAVNLVLLKESNTVFTLIIANKRERERYAIEHYSRIAEISINNSNDEAIKELQKEIKTLTTQVKNLNKDSKKEQQTLVTKIDSLQTILGKISIEKQKQLSNSEMIASLLANNLDNKDTVLTSVYLLFKKGEYSEVQKILDSNEMLREKHSYQQKLLLSKSLKKEGELERKTYVDKCLLKANLYQINFSYQDAEQWYKEAIESDSLRFDTNFSYAFILHLQNNKNAY